MNDKMNPIIEYLEQEGMAYLTEYEDKPFIIFEDWKGVHLMYSWIVDQAGAMDKYKRALAKAKRPDLYHGKALIQDLRLGKNRRFPYDDDPMYLIPDKVQAFLEDIEYDDMEWGFSDEYTTCSNCGCAIHTSPDSYSWIPDYLQTEDEILCPKCFDMDDYLEVVQQHMDRGRSAPAMPASLTYGSEWIKVEGDGYHGEFANGWYGGQDDDPNKQANVIQTLNKKISRIMRERHTQPYIQVLFDVSKGQFDIHWTTRIRKNPDLESDIEWLDLDRWAERLSDWFQHKTKMAHDPVETLKKALQSIPEDMPFVSVIMDPETNEVEYKPLELGGNNERTD